MSTKPTNPKDAIGSSKLPLHLWPTTATVVGCMALLDGALKYGRSNWRPGGVRALVERMTQQVERLKDTHFDRQPRHFTIADGDQA